MEPGPAKYGIVDGKVRTRALEYHIVDHCTMRCDQCCSFSPILKPWFADPGDFENDLRAASLAVAPQFLKLVGGEPLLHPELERLLAIARGLAGGRHIQLTTNGFLIGRLTPRAWECLDSLTVSLYPEPALGKERIRFIAREARARNVAVNWKVQDKFTMLDRTGLASGEEARATFRECWIRQRCNSIRDGRFYCCTRPQYIRRFAPDPRPFLDDGIPVGDPDTASLAARIKQHLERTEPLNSCYLCRGGYAPLDTNRQLTASGVAQKRERMAALCGLIASRP